MSTGIISILALVAIVIWGAVSRELVKSSKENSKDSKRRIITLMFAGVLSTILLIIFLYQKI
jgi:hypothetical protein